MAGAVEQREHSAGSLRLSVVPHASKGELGPFVRGVIDAREATVLTDGLPAYAHLESAGVDHRPEVQGDPARAAEILPWIHKVLTIMRNRRNLDLSPADQKDRSESVSASRRRATARR